VTNVNRFKTLISANIKLVSKSNDGGAKASTASARRRRLGGICWKSIVDFRQRKRDFEVGACQTASAQLKSIPISWTITRGGELLTITKALSRRNS